MTSRHRGAPVRRAVRTLLLAAPVVASSVLVACGGSDGVAHLNRASVSTFAEPGLGKPPALDGKSLPKGTFTVLGTSTKVDFSSLAGRRAIVNVWSTTCGPCVKEMPAFEALHRSLGDQVAVIGLNTGDTSDSASGFVAKVAVTYPIWMDGRGDGVAGLGISSLPTTIFVTAAGTIVKTKVGAMDEAAMTTTVKEVFGL